MPRLSPEIAALLLASAAVAAARPEAPAGPGDDCGSCHEAWPGGDRRHAPVSAKLCAACHRSSSPSQHRFALALEGEALCLQCHVSRDTRAHGHAPAARGLCLSCHEPHASSHASLLRLNATETCLTCHPAKRRVPLATAPGQCGATALACGSCHEAHAADSPAMLRAGTQRDTCLRCHAAPVTTHAGETLGEVATALRGLAGGTHLHGPAQEGRCTDCHQPHGTEAWRRLVRPLPAGPYAPYAGPATYALCFGCHDARLVTEPLLAEPGAPDALLTAADAGVLLRRQGVTAFRNGTDNLHAKHVRLEDKGRTCALCHDAHAASGRGLIRSSARLGDWNFRLGFTSSPTGGRCAPGCHAPRAYDILAKQENAR